MNLDKMQIFQIGNTKKSDNDQKRWRFVIAEDESDFKLEKDEYIDTSTDFESMGFTSCESITFGSKFSSIIEERDKFKSAYISVLKSKEDLNIEIYKVANRIDEISEDDIDKIEEFDPYAGLREIDKKLSESI